VYQATTQLTDESGQDIAGEIRVLLDNAIGPAGFYGVFTANMHTDEPDSPGADAIIAAAQARGVPVVSARQMLTWLDGRNTSSFQGLAFTGGRLSFTVAQGAGATGLQAMLPASGPTGALQAIARNGQPVAFATQTIKGITYATFPADAGSYVATYPAPPPAAAAGAAQGAAGKRTARIRTVEVLSRRTGAPTFPRLKLSTQKLRPGGGRSLAITFRLKHTSRVVLTFRTTKGKIVRRIRTPRRYKAGTVLRLRWDGRDSKGRYVKAGRYRFTLTATGSHYTKTARGSLRVLAAS
ncbi:MAG: FlgD immunoglobulin-like domain containing protein, partial [Solirubrobacteraceae bacterium]